MSHRTFNQSQRLASRRSAGISGTGTRSRPPTNLRTIDETAEIFNTSTRTIRRPHRLGCTAGHRLGRCVRISDLDIAVFLAANRSV